MEHINIVLVFLEGVLSLFSPCILPVLPVYFSMLSSSGTEDSIDENDKTINSTLLKNTVFFVLGISAAFFILGSSASALSYFISSNRKIILVIGGILIIFMGVFYMGLLNIPFLQVERKIHPKEREMNPLTAFILGFAFSFGWTPCIGPMLSSVLVMASTSKSMLEGNLLILIYTMGFILPFILISILYGRLLGFLHSVKRHMDIIEKVGGIILIISGIVMILQGFNVTFSSLKNEGQAKTQETQKQTQKKQQESAKVPAPDFSLVDQYGDTHRISDYKGKVVFLNFWATWCPPCKGEIPHIEDIYKEYGSNKKDVIILGVAAPNIGNEGSKNDIINFLNEGKYTFPVMFDNGGEVMEQYYINAFPTTFIIDKEGNVIKYVPGAMDKGQMESLINVAK